jgi:hypothetical protein
VFDVSDRAHVLAELQGAAMSEQCDAPASAPQSEQTQMTAMKGWDAEHFIYQCSDGSHNSFWKTVIESPEWKAWERELARRFKADLPDVWDIDESQECGWLSAGHFASFLAFVRSHPPALAQPEDEPRCTHGCTPNEWLSTCPWERLRWDEAHRLLLIVLFLEAIAVLSHQLWQSQQAQLRLESINDALIEQIRKERVLCGQAIRRIKSENSHPAR